MTTLKDELITRHKERNPERWTASLGESIPAPVPGSWETRRPSRVANLGGDVAVPLAQSLVSAVAGGVAAALLFRTVEAIAVGCGIAFVASWSLLLIDSRSLLRVIERVERATGVDIDRNGHVGKPPTFRVEVKEQRDGGYSLSYFDFPVSDEKMRHVARAVLVKGKNFSRPGLADVLTQSEYHKLAPMMVDAGLLADLPGNKRELTSAGRSLLRQLVE